MWDFRPTVAAIAQTLKAKSNNAALKLDHRRLVDRGFLRLIQFEEDFLLEAEGVGDKNGRKLLGCGVVFGGRAVEEAAGGGRVFFGAGGVGPSFLYISTLPPQGYCRV